ncbi:MAG: helix-hairpin-helix domain-containing protein [Marmoricola sp.]
MRRETEGEAAIRRGLERIGRDRVVGPVVGPGVGPVVVQPPGRHARAVASSSARPSWMPAFGATHLLVVATAVALALGLTAWLVLRSAPRTVDAPVARTAARMVAQTVAQTTSPSRTSSPSAAAGVAAGVAPATGPAPASATIVVVDVAGKVRRPGIVRLPVGSRVVDALRKAGGARHRGDLGALNLARPLVDGEQILVGIAPAAGASGAGAGEGAAGAGGAGSGDPVHLNSATLAQLDSLPGVGPVTAQKIVDWRTAHGRFNAVEELLEVDGIGDKTMADISPHVTL